MKTLYLLAFVLAGCASMPRAELADQAVFESYPVEQVREASRLVLEEINHSRGVVVRATEYHVLAEGRIGVCERDVACGGANLPRTQFVGISWTTIVVALRDLGEDTSVEVDIEYETTSHCGDGYAPVNCVPEQLSSTGYLEDWIIKKIRTRLATVDDLADRLPE